MENNTENNISQISAEIDLNCVGATDEQLVSFNNFRYWTEGVVQLILGTERSIFQTFWKLHCCAKFLFIELETSNFGYLLVFNFADL